MSPLHSVTAGVVGIVCALSCSAGCAREQREVAARENCIATSPSPDYFLPPTALTPLGGQYPRTLRAMYPQFLAAMGERSLYCGDRSPASYRVARIEWKGVPAAVTVERFPDGRAQLTATTLEAPAWNLPAGAIIGRHQRALTAEEWASVERVMSDTSFWTTPTMQSDGDAVDSDSHTWILEGHDRNHDYHIVSRTDVNAGPVHDAGMRLLSLAGITETELGSYAPGVRLRPFRPQKGYPNLPPPPPSKQRKQ